MRTIDQLLIPSRAGRRALVLAAACLLCACATSTTKRPEPIESQDETGFTITEQVRFSAKVRSEFDKALRLLEEEQYESGIELLQGVTTSAPDATAAHIDLGIAYRLVGDLERAEASIKSALELSPRHPAAHNELGIVYRRTGRFEDPQVPEGEAPGRREQEREERLRAQEHTSAAQGNPPGRSAAGGQGVSSGRRHRSKRLTTARPRARDAPPARAGAAPDRALDRALTRRAA